MLTLLRKMRCDIMMAYKRYRDALDYYKPGAATSAALANKTGIAYQQLLDLDNARKYYEKAIKLSPMYAEAINNLGTVYFAKKSYRRAIEQYRKALRIRPDSSSILSNLGTAYFARKKYDEAANAYQEAVAIDPDVFEQPQHPGNPRCRTRAWRNALNITTISPKHSRKRAPGTARYNTSARRSKKASRIARNS